MKNRWWFCLCFLLPACLPEAAQNSWDGTYIGYYHRNQQDTTPVKLVFEGKYFAASPHYATGNAAAEGIFQQQQTTLVFQNMHENSVPKLQGEYQFQYGLDGSIRIWQEEGTDFSEIIIRQQ